jgi:hypothetical protein
MYFHVLCFDKTFLYVLVILKSFHFMLVIYICDITYNTFMFNF